MDNRPNPEELLKAVQEEERHAKHGKLKIYLGAAPGVGKTYTMLEDAAAKRAQGLDVVIGVVESHGRKEIESLLNDFELLPRQQVEYRGYQLKEFDLDAALKRNPGLILVDEMAHTNAPGLRHGKRWQDIKEILDRGIDVYTTLNVQHIESLNDIVSQIIHVRVLETVPDSMMEMAETIELIDLPPEDLLKRLHEGKVYIPKQAEMAAEHFFRKGNLIALRELALRFTAERVGAQVFLYRQGQGIKHVWPTKEKILVCVGSRSASIKLIRTGRRMATSLKAEWIAVHVEMVQKTLTTEQRNIAIQNLRLAEQLGAETRILSGYDLVKEIINFAQEQNITKIVIGKRVQPRWKDILFNSIVDELVRNSGEIDVYIITGESSTPKTLPRTPGKRVVDWGTYLLTAGVVTFATLINCFLFPYLHISNVIMVYLLSVTIVALFGQTGPALMASVLSVFAFDYFFIPPLHGIVSSDAQYVFTMLVMLLVSQIISHLTILTRRQADASRLAERYTAALHVLSRRLASTRGIIKLLDTATRYLAGLFDSEVLALLPEEGRLVVQTSDGAANELSAKEIGVAQWVYDLGQMAGRGTDTLPYSDALYVPLITSQGSVGVLRIRPMQTGHLFTPEETRLLEACANQIALALEVDRLQEQRKKSELQTETDRARSLLLQSVSHDLRTPLVAVMGSASTLMEMGSALGNNKIKALGKDIYVELEQLNRLINNLLQMTYLEAESIKLEKKRGSLKEVIDQVITESAKKLGKRPVHIELPADLPEVPFAYTLIQEVFFNLLDNAIKFTAADTPINIIAQVEENKVVIKIEDQGPGIVPDEVNKLFEKFYRGRLLTTERGLGLGLAICRRIIKAHGGDMWAENRPQGGAVFYFSLPLQ